MKPLLILVSGLPCTGKTTLARKLARQLCLPLISRDDIKESLFDSLEWRDREWSKQLGIASYKLLFYFIETQARAGNSSIVESNFLADFDNWQFLELKKKYSLFLLEIHCQANREVLLQRFKMRSQSGERHPGHVDFSNYEEFKMTIEGKIYETIKVCDRTIEIDTTNFLNIDERSLLDSIEKYL